MFLIEILIYNFSRAVISSRNGTISYAYNDYAHPNAATDVTVVPGNTYSSYTYDANGNMTSRSITVDSITTNYTMAYDAEGHLIDLSGGSVDDRYVYDGDGNMVVEIENGVRTIKLGSFEVVLSNGAIPSQLQNPPTIPSFGIYGNDTFNTTQTTTIYPNITWKSYYGNFAEQIQGGEPLNLTDGVYYLLKDNLGSLTEVVDPNGTVTHTRYTAWGETRSTSGTMPTDNLYTGQDRSSNSGLYFYQSRWYDPSISRWIQPDSIIPNPFTPRSYDRYSYVGNNPINYKDPSGHLECPIMDKACVLEETSPSPATWVQLTGFTSDKEVLAIYQSVTDLGNSLAQEYNSTYWLASLDYLGGFAYNPIDPKEAFLSTFNGPVQFIRSVLNIEYAGITRYYSTTNQATITIYNVNGITDYIVSHPRVIVHELGHAFEFMSRYQASNPLPDSLLRSGISDHVDIYGRWFGFAGGYNDWQFGWQNDRSEVYADMFVGWTYNNNFDYRDINEVELANKRKDFMNSTMGRLTIELINP